VRFERLAVSLINQTITKRDAANRQIEAAIRLFMSGDDMVAVHTLACAAREIYEKHCEFAGIERFYDLIVKAFPEKSKKEIFEVLNKPRNFFKHSDSNSSLDATIELSDRDNKLMLFLATHDCATLLEDKAPKIVHAYNAWFIATEPDCKHESYENYLENWYPDIKSVSDKEQRVIGRQLIDDIISGKIII
jgi:hypothetical protein